MSQDSFPIVVSSCDAYADLWPSFFHLLFRYWPETAATGKVYLISSKRRFNDPRVTTLALGHDRHWGSNTLEALGHIQEKSLLYLQDDYFLNAPANEAAIQQLHKFHLSSNALATSLLPRAAFGRATEVPGLIEVDPKNEWVFDFQAAFWDKEKIASWIEEGWTPWHAEGAMNDRARRVSGGFYSMTQEHPPFLPYTQVIRGSLWLPEGRELCRTHGLHPNFGHRPCAPFQAGFLNRFYRSYLKRRSRSYRKSHPIAEGSPVEPIL